jgi:coenzyme F420-0:L-glutamate ligase / coenzyme F420-1:gamma-L-glutamate ligase
MPRTRSDRKIEIIAIRGVPEIHPGDDLPALLVQAAGRQRLRFSNGDVLVVAQKIVSKSEGALAALAAVAPSPLALELAPTLKKDPRFVEIILQQSRRIVRKERVLIVETRHGFVCANAGVDHSNIPGDGMVSLLPSDPDASARRIARAMYRATNCRIAVIISDTFGRPWRLGLSNVAIGASGLPVLRDLRGKRDHTGKRLESTVIAAADELASAAGLVMDKSAGIPAVIIRGCRFRRAEEPARKLLRPPAEDLFR